MEKVSSNKHRDTWYNADGSLFADGGDGRDIWETDEDIAMTAREAAEAALEYLNNHDGGKKYELVDHGPTMAISRPTMNHLNFMAKEKDCPSAPFETYFARGPTMAIAPPMMNHLNFLAKEKDCPSAPVETFFAQLSFVPDMRVDCCVTLGPSQEVPHWSEAEFGGCNYCPGFVNHPTKGVDNFAFNKSPLKRARSV